MTVADLLTALSELRAGRVTVEQLIAACSAWSNEPTRPLADFLQAAKAAPPVPLAEPASGVLAAPADRRPAAARRVAARGGPNRALVWVAAGVGLLALVGMGIGLGYLGQSNARLEAANAKLTAANAELADARDRLEQANAQLVAARGSNDVRRDADRPRDPKGAGKEGPGKTPVGPAPVPPRPAEPAKNVRALEDALAKVRQSAGPDDPRTVQAAANLGVALVEAGRPAEAIPLLEDVGRKAKPDQPGAAAAAVALARALRAAGKADRAIELCERVRGELPAGDPLEPEARVQLALAYRAAGQWDRARTLFLDHLVFAQKSGKEPRQAAQALGWMGECLLKLGDADTAEPLVRECLDLRTKLGAAEWPTFAARSLLGEVLLAQKKPDQAEALLTAGYDGLKARKDAIPWDEKAATLADAAGRLVKLYEARGDKDKAAEWKKVEEQSRREAATR
jgi:tetratricopeptide (TPR) repeat protein